MADSEMAYSQSRMPIRNRGYVALQRSIKNDQTLLYGKSTGTYRCNRVCSCGTRGWLLDIRATTVCYAMTPCACGWVAYTCLEQARRARHLGCRTVFLATRCYAECTEICADNQTKFARVLRERLSSIRPCLPCMLVAIHGLWRWEERSDRTEIADL